MVYTTVGWVRIEDTTSANTMFYLTVPTFLHCAVNDLLAEIYYPYADNSRSTSEPWSNRPLRGAPSRSTPRKPSITRWYSKPRRSASRRHSRLSTRSRFASTLRTGPPRGSCEQRTRRASWSLNPVPAPYDASWSQASPMPRSRRSWRWTLFLVSLRGNESTNST